MSVPIFTNTIQAYKYRCQLGEKIEDDMFFQLFLPIILGYQKSNIVDIKKFDNQNINKTLVIETEPDLKVENKDFASVQEKQSPSLQDNESKDSKPKTEKIITGISTDPENVKRRLKRNFDDIKTWYNEHINKDNNFKLENKVIPTLEKRYQEKIEAILRDKNLQIKTYTEKVEALPIELKEYFNSKKDS